MIYDKPPVRPPSEYDTDDSATSAITYAGAGKQVLPYPTRGIWVGVQCDLSVTMAADSLPTTFYGALGLMPLCVSSIDAGNTTVVALF